MSSASKAAPPSDPFEDLGISPAAAAILRYFLIRPDACPHAREIQRRLNLGGASLHRELARLVTAGALRRSPDGRYVRYSISDDEKLWTAFRLLASRASDPLPLVRDALGDVTGVCAAFVFGSVAHGEDNPDSDVDLLVIEGTGLDRRRLFSQIAEVELLLGREIHVLRYSMDELAERLGDAEHPASRFVRTVLTGTLVAIAGDPRAIANLAAAAGLRVA